MHNILHKITDYKNIISIARVLFSVLVLAASAQVLIPIDPVPITLQTLVIAIIVLVCEKREAPQIIGLYLLCGMVGLPVFMKMGSGLTHFTGPSAGYLCGFMLAGLIVPVARERLPLWGSAVLTQALIYLPGVLWLSSFIGIELALYKGFIVYLPSGCVKVGLLLTALHYIKKD